MQRFRLPAVILCALFITLLAAACSPDPTPTPAPTPTPEMQEWEPILGTTVLRAGTQRVAFLLASGSALVRVP